jgi:hypothetical protein
MAEEYPKGPKEPRPHWVRTNKRSMQAAKIIISQFSILAIDYLNEAEGATEEKSRVTGHHPPL